MLVVGTGNPKLVADPPVVTGGRVSKREPNEAHPEAHPGIKEE